MTIYRTKKVSSEFIKMKMKSIKVYYILLTCFIIVVADFKVTNASLCNPSVKVVTNQNSSLLCSGDSSSCPNLSVCYSSTCICRLGYAWSPTESTCARHECTRDVDCYTYYPHTECRNNACVCDDVSQFCPLEQACVYLPNSKNYLFAILGMAGLFVIVSVGSTLITYWWTKRRYQKQRENQSKESSSMMDNSIDSRNYQTDSRESLEKV